MKKLQFIFVIFVYAFSSYAQKDSLKKLHFSGFVIETYFIGTQGPANNYNKEDFQKYIKNNDLLNQDLSGYKNGFGGAFQSTFNGLFSAKFFFDLKPKKHLRPEVFIGLRFGTSEIASASYLKTQHDTTGTYVNTSNNTFVTSVSEYNYSYYYQISSKRLLVPFGININTNKNNRFWFAAGIELAPGISFANTFSAFYDVNKTDLVLNPNSNYDHWDTYSRSISQDVERKQTTNTLKGIGFSGYATLPLTMNFRLAKRVKFFKHLNINTSLAPGIYYAQNKYTGSQSNFAVNASLGLRYNW